MKKLIINAFVSLAIACSSLAGNARSKLYDAALSTIEAFNEKIDTGARVKRYNKIINDPVHDYGDGGGYALPTYYDEHDNTTTDDFFDKATIVGEQGNIEGSLKVYGDYDPGYLYKRIDVDIFRFSIHEERKYTFELVEAPHVNYYFEIYRYSTVMTDLSRMSSNVNTLLYSSRQTSRKCEMILRPGTYFIGITSSTKNGIRPEIEYKFTFKHSYVEDEYFEEVDLNDAFRYQYETVVWENECSPYNISRVSDEPQVVYTITDVNHGDYTEKVYDGYIDPIFTENENGNSTKPFDRYWLDSIMFITSNYYLAEYVETLGEIADELDQKFKNERIQKLEASVKESAGSLILEIVAIGFEFAKVSLSPITFPMALLSFVMTLAYLLSYDVKKDLAPTAFQLGYNLSLLRQKCLNILNGLDNTNVIAIPKYCSLFTEDDYGTGHHYCKMSNTIFINSLYSDDYFLYPKNKMVQRVQPASFNYTSHKLCNEITRKGKIRFYETVEGYHYFGKLINDYTEGAFGPELSYSISKSSNGYKLFVYNQTNEAKEFTYNTSNANNNEGEHFNLKANGSETISLKKYGSKTISLGNRSNVFIREGKNTFVTKVSYENGDTVYSNPIIFGKEYLKASIVGKSGNRWTIRITNLTGSTQYFYYNTKMCFSNDAASWSNLNDWTSTRTYLPNNGYVDVYIYENWFADSIAISYVDDRSNTRYISYANGLDNGSKTLNYQTSYVGI